jgi:hypothetical protein
MITTEGKWPTDIKKWRIVQRLYISDPLGEIDIFQCQAYGIFRGWHDQGPESTDKETLITWIQNQCRDKTTPTENVVWIGGVYERNASS